MCVCGWGVRTSSCWDMVYNICFAAPPHSHTPLLLPPIGLPFPTAAHSTQGVQVVMAPEAQTRQTSHQPPALATN